MEHKAPYTVDVHYADGGTRTPLAYPFADDPIAITVDSHDDAAVDLLPCPFCGDTDVTVLESDACWFGYCNGCLARGPREMSRERAVEEWNARAGIAQAIVDWEVARLHLTHGRLYPNEEAAIQAEVAAYLARAARQRWNGRAAS